jgi:2,4-dienoyl-CoA reductase-like NADH-dependent reductase (Old Yellow Enzyme family)/pyruvate/2-oxoglutarate dehydrogenase complex dihydrolipoamide dehydrogenase (E3) component
MIGPVEIKNRFVEAATEASAATEHGYVNDRLIRRYVREAQGGVGLINTSITFVREDGKIFTRQMGLSTDTHVGGHEELTRAVKRYGTRIFCQLVHGGTICGPNVSGAIPQSPSGVPLFYPEPHTMSTEEADEMVEVFAQAAARAKVAGYDGVEWHGCHGTLIGMFVSPRDNLRTDKYAGPTAFWVAIIKRTIELCGPDFPQVARVSADEFLEDIGQPSMNIDRMCAEVIPALEAAGLHGFHASAGRIGLTAWHQIPPLYLPRGKNVYLAERIKQVTKLPVITVGRIFDPKLAEQIVATGRADMVALARPIIADPDFVKKAVEGRPEEIRKCIGCMICNDRLFFPYSIICSVNAEYLHYGEADYKIEPVVKPKKVMIVGGGLAGMEAARIAAQRGHDVTVYERGNTLGGFIPLAANIPHVATGELYNIVEYLTTQMQKLNVKVELNTEITLEKVEAQKPDAVIVATGSLTKGPQVPGIDDPCVVTLDDVLSKKAKVGPRVVVLGGAHGSEVALSLAKQGKSVTVLEPSAQTAGAVYFAQFGRAELLRRMMGEAGVISLTETQVKAIVAGGVQVIGKDGKEQVLPADTVVNAWTRVQDDQLARALRGKVMDLYTIGDATGAHSIAKAIEDGNWAGRIV